MIWQPEEFDDLAAELRQRVGAEFRSEAEEVERLVQLQRKRKALLREVAIGAMHQGDRVTLRAFGDEWSGELIAVGKDYLSLLTPTASVNARLEAIAIGLTPARHGGRTGRPASETFKARLTEFEMAGNEVNVRCQLPDIAVTGIIEVVANDHVQMRLPTEWCYLPLDGVVMAITSLPE